MNSEILINELVLINYEIRDMQSADEIKNFIRNRIESHKQPVNIPYTETHIITKEDLTHAYIKGRLDSYNWLSNVLKEVNGKNIKFNLKDIDEENK